MRVIIDATIKDTLKKSKAGKAVNIDKALDKLAQKAALNRFTRSPTAAFKRESRL